MVSDNKAANRLPNHPTALAGPRHLSDLHGRGWWDVFKRTGRQFQADNLSDWAAALTYYSVLSLFPGILVLLSLLGLAGDSTTRQATDTITAMAPGTVRDLLRAAVRNIEDSQQSTAGLLAIVGLVGALWSASGYVGAFMRAANAIYGVPEGRPLWKVLPLRLGITVVTGLGLAVTSLAVVLTGGIARQVGKFLHLGSGLVTAWDIAKWPVLVIVVSLIFALLYWASPNARHGGFRWITPGGLLAVVIWLAASTGFGFYVANFGSYNKTYGSFATVIVFLVWLWISNLAILLGAEFDAELQRGRAIAAGHDPDDEPYMELRDTSKVGEHASKQ